MWIIWGNETTVKQTMLDAYMTWKCKNLLRMSESQDSAYSECPRTSSWTNIWMTWLSRPIFKFHYAKW